MVRRPSPIVVVIGVLTALGSSHAEVDLVSVNPSSVATCDKLVIAHPDHAEAYRCYQWMAHRHQRWSEAIRRLDALLEIDPNDHNARLYLGSIEADRFRPRAESLLRDAAEGFEDQGHAEGEVRARVSLANYLLRRGRSGEAAAETRLAEGVARASGDPELNALVRIQQAWTAYRTDDYATARSLFKRLEAELIPQGSALLQAEVLGGMGAVAWAEGRHEEAFDDYRRAVDRYRRMGDTYAESGDRYNMALLAARLHQAGKGMGLDEVRALMYEAVEVAQRGRNRGAEAAARLLVAQDPDRERAERIREIEQALALTREIGDKGRACFALRLLANQLAGQDREEHMARALALTDEALELARSIGSLPDVARAYITRTTIGPSARPREEVIADYLAAIETTERIRDLQWDELVQARSLWNWTFLYYRAAGFLLEPVGRQPAPEDANLAFTIVERLRARTLLDTLDAAHATDAVLPEGEDRQDHREVLERIAAVQRDLLGPGLSEREAAVALSELELLEIREAELRNRIARSEPSYALLRKPEIPSIEDVQRLLASDQAMLAFQLSNRETSERIWFWNGGSWVFVITRDSVKIVPLPDEGVLEQRIPVFLGLLGRRDEFEREAAARLYADLLGEALDRLPPEISRLVVVPDRALHRLPFGALRSSPSHKPLAARFEISAVPSATLWRHWKRQSAPPGRAAVLALADPEWPSSFGGLASERATVLTDGLETRPLPHARREAKRLVRLLGGDSRLVAGIGASERFVKTVGLDHFGVLHFATHAVVDDRQPQRSAVLLAPGAAEEDGLLQMREVVELDLEGRVVILSACSSASGELTAGEGVVGLARAFFQAGARVVVGSLWPLRDDEAAELVEDVGRHLQHGKSVGAALALASRARIEAGAPTAAWAGLVVLGDADVVPIPGGRQSSADRLRLTLAILAVLVVAIVIVFTVRRRKSRST